MQKTLPLLLIALLLSACTSKKPKPCTVVPAQLLQPIKGTYPQSAMEQNDQGPVKINIMIDETGKVSEVIFLKKNRSSALNRAAEKAARNAKFKPASCGKKNIKSQVTTTILFTLK